MKRGVEASDLKRLGFRPALTWTVDGGRFDVTPTEAADLPPPLVYVFLDRNGHPVKTGRSLAQSIRQRFGSTSKGMNRESTRGQNLKRVVRDLAVECTANGPLTTWARPEPNRASAIETEKWLFDNLRGRIDRRRG